MTPIRPRQVCGIVPPYILENIARHGSADERDRALAQLRTDERLRARDMRSAGPTDRLEGDRHDLTHVSLVKERTVFDARQGTDLPGAEVRREDGPSSDDRAVNEAYDGLGATWDLYHDVLGRGSYDDAGGALLASVHYDRRLNNAFWDGSQMVLGDGDGIRFRRFTIVVDIMAHELTHAVTQSSAGLVYRGQSGALNESVSDVFGSLVKQRAASPPVGAADADWLIGEGIFTPAVSGVALRSMKAPGTAFDDPVLGRDPQPTHMADYLQTRDDDGGVHTNSGIPNHAFYLCAVALGGYAWERAGRVWYAALTDTTLAPDSSFADFARSTSGHAQRLFGADVAQACTAAWAGVGVDAAT